MESLKIWLLTIGATIAYGIAHDQVTARVSIEYFTVGHQEIFQTTSPTLIALGWGILATWWVGALMGLIFALVARFGSRPKTALRELLVPGGVLLACVGFTALVAGIAGFFAARAGLVSLGGYLATEVPAGGHARFIADLWAHTASYVAGLAGGSLLAAWVWIRRGRAMPTVTTPVLSPSPPTSG